MTAADKEAIEVFKRDVIEPSMTKLVILDFWAEWCGPCKALTPTLEKIAADYADKGVLLAKINVDENKLIAAQFQVQSIPTVYAVFQGQLVADLTNYRSESQLTKALDQVLRQLPVQGEAQSLEAEIEPLLAMGEQTLSDGDTAQALDIFTQVLAMAPDHAGAISGQIRALIAAGDTETAASILDSLPEDKAADPAIERAAAALSLAQTAQPLADTSGIEARIAADADDHEARLELAGAYFAGGDRDAAADQLLIAIERDRAWNDAAARKQLLQMFEVIGLEDPWVAATRRRLSAVLFG
jgi:putative thioredoxin